MFIISVSHIYYHSGAKQASSMAVIYIERSYVNHILQVSMDRIIDAFGKRKNCESFI